MKTNQDIKGVWFGEELTIPKGTRVTQQSACGLLPEGQYFIDDFSWVLPYDNGLPRSGFIHDATYRGILVTGEFVE